jgi:hypothetical protein
VVPLIHVELFYHIAEEINALISERLERRGCPTSFFILSADYTDFMDWKICEIICLMKSV